MIRVYYYSTFIEQQSVAARMCLSIHCFKYAEMFAMTITTDSYTYWLIQSQSLFNVYVIKSSIWIFSTVTSNYLPIKGPRNRNLYHGGPFQITNANFEGSTLPMCTSNPKLSSNIVVIEMRNKTFNRCHE